MTPYQLEGLRNLHDLCIKFEPILNEFIENSQIEFRKVVPGQCPVASIARDLKDYVAMNAVQMQDF